MRRQLKANGGITNLRQGYGLGDFVRKLIPNEIADVAVKAAPFVAPFNPLAAGIMRGVGRYDQRGSLKDALKQGVLTYAGGQGARMLGGKGFQTGFNPMTGSGAEGGKFLSDFRGPGKFFKGDTINPFEATANAGAKKDIGLPGFRDISKKLNLKIPGLGSVSELAKQQLLFGATTGGITYIYEKFMNEEPEQQLGESYGEYLARRKKNVAAKMRQYKDNYLAFDKDWTAMSDEEKNEQIQSELTEYDVPDANMNQGGRVGLRLGGDPLPEDPTEPINPFKPKPIGPVLPDNSMMAESKTYMDYVRAAIELGIKPIRIDEFESLTPIMDVNQILKLTDDLNKRSKRSNGGFMMASAPDPMDERNSVMEMMSEKYYGRPLKDLTDEEIIEIEEMMDEMDLYGSKTTAPNRRMASNDQNTAQLERLYEDFLEMGLSPEAAADAARKAFERMQDDFTSAPEGIRSTMAAQGGRIGYAIGSPEKQLEAGAPPIMYSGNMDPNEQAGLPSVPGPIQMAEDGPEFDMRENGGFQPLGRQEGKDDVPAMLAKNEFVMTADAVRAAGGGSIEKGAQKMYDTMKKLESRVS